MKKSLGAPIKTVNPQDLRDEMKWHGWVITPYLYTKRNQWVFKIASDCGYDVPSERSHFSKIEFYEDFMVAVNQYGNLILNKRGQHIVASAEVMGKTQRFLYVDKIDYIIEDGDDKYLSVSKVKRHWTHHGLVEYGTLRDVILDTERPSSEWPCWEIEDVYDGIAVARDLHGYIHIIPMLDFPHEFRCNETYQRHEYLGNHVFRLRGGEKDFTPLLQKLFYFKVTVLLHKNTKVGAESGIFDLSKVSLSGHYLTDRHRILVLQEESNEALLVAKKDARILSRLTMTDVVPCMGYKVDVVFDRNGHFNLTEINKILHDRRDGIVNGEAELDQKYWPVPRGAERDRNVLADVYNKTLEFVKDGEYQTQEYEITIPLSASLAQDTKFYSEELNVTCDQHRKTRIKVVDGDCLEIAYKMYNSLKKKRKRTDTIAVLNMASSKKPGGRAHIGAITQEAYLIRCSDYYRSIYQFDAEFAEKYGLEVSDQDKRYPLDPNFGGIYSPKVTVFRQSAKNGYALRKSPWKVNIIAVAGCRRPISTEKEVVNAYIRQFKNKIRTILRIAIDNKQTNLVLGPMGCGGLENIPATVAEIFFSVLSEDEFKKVFRRIYFAVLDDEASLKAFQDECDAFQNGKVYDRVMSDATKEIRTRRSKILRLPADRTMSPEMFQQVVSLTDNGCMSLKDAYRQINICNDVEYDYIRFLYALVFDIVRNKIRNINIEESLREVNADDVERVFKCFDEMEEMQPQEYMDQLNDEGFDEELVLLAYIKYFCDHPEMEVE